MNVWDQLADYIQRKLNFSVHIGLLHDRQGVAIVPMPSSPEHYMRGRMDEVAFQVYSKHENQQTAMGLVADLVELLDTGEFYGCRVTTLPHFVEEAEGVYMYTALFSAEIEV